MTPGEVNLAVAALQALTTFFANKDRTDIPAEMQEALDAAHKELDRLKSLPSADDGA